ncbi:cytochrome P450 [Amylocarpus encephaloides]|uniref:Cytochrome P450 n=1 Tax=Amylocarpus encephaloides TaxID=45428 RepID=A0A9P7YPM9_9HELO|nr:cytochrome P450 [Amylocarpus encephaloides]
MEAAKLTIFAPWLVPFLIAGALLLLINGFRRARGHREPPFIAPKFPIFGHLIGFTQRRFDYYYDLYKSSRHEIYTLSFPGMPGGKVYVLNSPKLLPHAQRVPHKISLAHVDAIYTAKIAGLSDSAGKTFAEYSHVGESKPTYLAEGLSNAYSATKPGPLLNRATKVAVETLEISLRKLDQNETNSVEFNAWVRNEIAVSITQSAWGPQNPYQDPEICRAFWEFQENVPGVMFFPFSKYTCARPYAAREKVTEAFIKFYANGGNDTASPWVQGATNVSNRWKITDLDKARLDIANSHGIIANATPTGFWTMYHIFSDQAVLQEVRATMEPLLTTTEIDGNINYILDVCQIREIPLMKSILYEVLRCYANGVGTRMVVEDTVLADRHLLKKGSFLFISNQSCHLDQSSWGPTAHQFNARRFVESKTPRNAFVGWGGGQSMCPGRFLAQNQILSFCAMMALRFEARPRGGSWVHPGTDTRNTTINVHPPKREVLVDITPREGRRLGSWRFSC